VSEILVAIEPRYTSEMPDPLHGVRSSLRYCLDIPPGR
jgi:hypothetical protein